MGFGLHVSEEQRLLVETVRGFVEDELFPHESLVDRLGEVPAEIGSRIKARAKELGLHAANMPEAIGGGGLDRVTLTLMERELGKASWALHGFVARPSEILLACAGDQIGAFLLPCVRGEKKEFFALTEPGAGSDVIAMETRAEREGSDFLISGTKHFISGAGMADFAIVFAVTGISEGKRGRPKKEITAFLVDTSASGLQVRRGPRSVSYRGYPNYQLHFDQCRVSADAVLGEVGRGLELAGQWLSAGRLTIAAGCCGKAERLLQLAAEWAATRQQFGQTIGRFQGTSFKLADIATELRAADLLTLDAAAKHDRGQMTSADAAMAKLFASEMLGRAADHAVQIFGGMGLTEELPIERMWRDARIERIWDGTSEIQRHIISRELLAPLESAR